MARRFEVVRTQDVTGVSGTGIVAEGVEFSDGTAVVRWHELPEDSPSYQRGVRATTVMFPSADAVEALHGHNGATVLVWLDEADVEVGARPCYEEVWSWDHFDPNSDMDAYWIRCTQLGPHDEHEDANTGLTWGSA